MKVKEQEDVVVLMEEEEKFDEDGEERGGFSRVWSRMRGEEKCWRGRKGKMMILKAVIERADDKKSIGYGNGWRMPTWKNG